MRVMGDSGCDDRDNRGDVSSIVLMLDDGEGDTEGGGDGGTGDRDEGGARSEGRGGVVGVG